MKLLDEKGIGTVWSICKEKFALVGHTHNYAGSGSPGGSANSAIGVVDYNNTGKTIQIGYSGAGISGDDIKCIAGYTSGGGGVNAKIKDISKGALKSWLGLSSVVSDIGFSLDYNTGANTLKVTKADGTVTYKGIFKASESNDGFMSKEDKVKLNGIASGANNYTLPTASDTTLGGIKVSTIQKGTEWPISVDRNGIANTYISGLNRLDDCIGSVTIEGQSYRSTYYEEGVSITNKDDLDAADVDIKFPYKSGIFALLSDIPDVSNLCNFNFVNSTSECKSGRINFLLRCSDSLINLDPFDTYPDGTILIISVSDNSVPVKHNSGGWFCEGDEVGAGYTAYIYKESLKLITKHAGKVYYYPL